MTRFGGVTGRVLDPGLNFKIPFIERTKTIVTQKSIYETTTDTKQKGSQANYKDYPVDTNTSDGQRVDVFYTIRFSADPSKASWLVSELGGMDQAVEKIVKAESRIWVRTIPREYKANDLYTGSGVVEVQNKIYEVLYPKFSDNGLILDSVGIREIQFSEEYITAVERKQIEEVNIETESNRALQAEKRKEATILDAEAQAESQRLQRESISDQVLEKIWIEKWNGQLPTYVTGDAANLIQIPSN